MTIQIGLHLTTFDFPGVPVGNRVAHALTIARAAEDAGFGTLWLNDHLIDGDGTLRPETYVFLSTVAACTGRLRLGALASSIFFRPPAVLARMVATLDEASGGRAVLGVGAGHPRTEAEHQRFGLEFPPIRDRMDRLEAALPELRELAGRSVPVMVAGSGEHRLLRIVARYADMCNLSVPSGDTLDVVRHRLDILATHCRAVGRDYAQITKTYKAIVQLGGEPADPTTGRFRGSADDVRAGAQAFVDAGIDEVIVQIDGVESLDAIHTVGGALASLIDPRSSARGISAH